MQHSDGDIAIVLEIVREIHRGHAARAELAVEAIAVGQGASQARHDVSHGTQAWSRESSPGLVTECRGDVRARDPSASR